MITSAEIRASFLSFFGARGHAIVKSSSLVPGNDPTLLFANAGMVQFKDVFLGHEQRPYTRATTAQKVMRVSGKHNDLDEVGPSPRHHTFFEMLGNFSFGDYFKAEAIAFAWEFLTKEMGLDRQRLRVTVFHEDDEARDLWHRGMGVPSEWIFGLGAKDNFWEMGETGPCGPDSEIFYDRGPQACSCGKPNCTPADKCDRWPEIWNLVFMQYQKHEDGHLTPLPRPSIDTGMGMERFTSILQGVASNYDTDLFMPIMRRTQALLGHDDETRVRNYIPYRVIADHSRALTFLIADGIMPGNEGRNYVLRLILRRAARFGRRLGFTEPFLAETARAVINVMSQHYTELAERADFICQVITQEEERFLTTLDTGLARLDQLTARLKAEGQRVIPGGEAFRLYDTYGFPLELTRDAAEEAGFSVDVTGFGAAMQEQRERARAAQRFAAGGEGEFYRQLALPRTRFLGYSQTSATARVLALVQAGRSVGSAGAGEEVDVVLDATPFYGESGGQVGDAGELRSQGALLTVRDTARPIPELTVHRATVAQGRISVGDAVEATVDAERRLDIARNHTATHLLHRALRQVLGEHAAQSGSLVAPDRLRFDFSHLAALTADELARVAAIVNAQVRADLPVSTEEKSYDDATRGGAVALFGEKYGDVVRVVTVEGFSSELCGGTHLARTGQIGLFLLEGEASVGAGLRRIEALTGRGAEAHVRQRLETLATIGQVVVARPGQELERVQEQAEQLREQRRAVQELQRALSAFKAEDLLSHVQHIGAVAVLAAQAPTQDVEALRELCDRFRERLGSAVVALGAVVDERPMMIVALTADLVKRGLNANQLVREAAKRMDGGGGGRPEMARAGGKDANRLPEALQAVVDLVAAALA